MNDSREFQLSFDVTEDLLRVSRARFRQRYFGWPFYVALILLFPAMTFLWTFQESRVVAAVVTGVLATLFALAMTVRLMRRRQFREHLAKYPDRRAVVTFSDDGFAEVSSWATVKLPWNAFRNTWWFDEVALLFFTRFHYFLLPLSAFSPESIDMLKSKVPERRRLLPGA
jgi:hypothetical protein